MLAAWYQYYELYNTWVTNYYQVQFTMWRKALALHCVKLAKCENIQIFAMTRCKNATQRNARTECKSILVLLGIVMSINMKVMRRNASPCVIIIIVNWPLLFLSCIIYIFTHTISMMSQLGDMIASWNSWQLLIRYFFLFFFLSYTHYCDRLSHDNDFSIVYTECCRTEG